MSLAVLTSSLNRIKATAKKKREHADSFYFFVVRKEKKGATSAHTPKDEKAIAFLGVGGSNIYISI